VRGNIGTNKTWTLTLLKNTVATAITSTIDGNSEEGTNVDDEVSVAAGEYLIWRLEGETGEPAPAKISSISFERSAPANQ
jgi:hypothetical protein